MQTKLINGKAVGPIGYGMLGFAIPPALDYAEATKLLKTALENGANLWNGSLHYGTPQANTIHVIKYYFEQYPEDAEKVVLTLKGAYSHKSGPVGTPEGIRASVDAAFEVLKGVKTIDVFAMARVDPNVPIETSVQALAVLVQEGKIGGIGLSEVSGSTIQRACAVHPIASAEIELSLFTPDVLHNGVAEACREGGVQMIAYSPLGRGWLTQDYQMIKTLPANDLRRSFARFQDDVFDQNAKLVEAIGKIAQRKDVTTAQVALSWVSAQGAIPIPGSKRAQRIMENCKNIALTDGELAELKNILAALPVSGQRYGGVHERLLNG